MYQVYWTTPMGVQTATTDSYYAAVSIATALQSYHNCAGFIRCPDGQDRFAWTKVLQAQGLPVTLG